MTDKTTQGAKIVDIVAIYPHRCKYTTDTFISAGTITLAQNINDSFTGACAISGGNALLFDDTVYLKVDDEIMAITVDSNIQVTITARAKFGTTATAHVSGTLASIIHEGEANGSCYGYPHSCTSANNFASDEWEFIFPTYRIRNMNYFSGLERSPNITPPKVDPSETMGSRGKAAFSIKDGVDTDVYTVPYPAKRTGKGDLFKKLIARAGYLENRRCVIWSGYYQNGGEIDFSSMIKREYIIDSFNNSGNTASFSCLDPLILTEDKKAKVPLQSNGRLTSEIADASTDIVVDTDSSVGVALGSTVYYRIDSEIIETTKTTATSYAIVSRAYKSTKADHSIGATVQECFKIENVNPVTVIKTLLEDYTTTKAAWLDDYTDVINELTAEGVTMSGILTKPTEVKKVIDEAIKVGDLVMWFDAKTSKTRIKRVVNFGVEAINLDEQTGFLKDSIDANRDASKQYSRYNVLWGKSDATKGETSENYSVSYIEINAATELDRGLGERNEKKEYYFQLLENKPSESLSAVRVASDVMIRNNQVPIELKFDIDASEVFARADGTVLEEGSIINCATYEIQDENGNPKAQNYQVLQLTPRDNGSKYQVLARLYQDIFIASDYDFVISESAENYVLSDHFAPSAGTYKVYIQSSVTLGATSTANYAFDTGAQAAGVKIELYNDGKILAAGGKGGNGGTALFEGADKIQTAQQPGARGGHAINAQCDLDIYSGAGLVWAGGGGSSGLSGYFSGNTGYGGEGGCGGAGYGIAFGGEGGIGNVIGEGGPIGTVDGPGVSGSNYGGDYGEAGRSNYYQATLIAGGESGLAIKTNGYNVTIKSGSGFNIKGLIQ